MSAIATGCSRGDQGRHEMMHHLRSRNTMLAAAVIIVAGSLLFITQSVIILDHAVVDHGFRPGESRVDVSGLRSSVITEDGTKRLGVVVPTFDVDLGKALNSLAYWPTTCYQTTLQKMDFILYYAGGAEDKVSERFLSRFAETGGRCFARTRIVLGNLTDEEDVYPKGPSVQFYKMFLDERIRMQLSEYEVLALIEWDVIVAHESSFHQLYQVAFSSVEPFWVKGSTLDGVNFHDTVVMSESRFLLGHINGNALYNNSDPAFVEFIEYTLKRWDYSLSYDVALWATVADLPYSWPLWQRYARKFVVTNLISNVGFMDVKIHTVGKAVASDTLFIHGSLTGRGGSMFKARASLDTSHALDLLGRNMPIDKCTATCGSSTSISSEVGMATVCDRSCSSGEYGPRFGGLNCGAGNPKQFGKECRVCYNDLGEAREAEAQLAQKNAVRGAGFAQEHVIMCNSLLPPPALACSSKCTKKVDTVCDESCEWGRYNSYNCNWRGYGDNCRFCFHDREAALKADAVAEARGGRVIMCHTHEPPMKDDVWTAMSSHYEEIAKGEGDGSTPEETEAVISSESDDEENESLAPDKEIYVGDIKRGQLCAFMVGKKEYLIKTHVAAKSIAHFMPGMRIAIATPPREVSAHESTLGYLPGVRVEPALRSASLSALLADQYCGNDTRLIYYMNPGEVLWRTFTAKDTHSMKDDLLVVNAEVDRVGEVYKARTLATTSVLGFSSPSFSFGVDIMLPAEINKQLRDVLLSDPEAGLSGKSDVNPHMRAIRAMEEYKEAFIPEVLAALAYSRNPPGVWFVDPKQWVTYHLFEPASIWDIPLVKPRFGCYLDVSMVSQSDMAREMEQELDHFIRGGTCEKGFIRLNDETVRSKAHIDVGAPNGRAKPTEEGLAVSVVFNIDANVHPISLEASLTSVIEKFPDASEAVVIFHGPLELEDQVMKVIEAHDQRANFRVFAVKTPVLKDKNHGDDWDWSGLHADEYCSGKVLLNMEPGDVLMTQVANSKIFHFRKPVILFDRVTKLSTDVPNTVDECMVDAVASALGQPIIHNFTLLRSLAYPREAYENLREFVEKNNGTDIDTFVNQGRTSCKTVGIFGSNEPPIRAPRARYEMSLLGAFMWHNMHNAVHWRALHILDAEPDEWPTDIESHNLYCDLRSLSVPEDANAAKIFVDAAGQVNSPMPCTSFKKNMDVDL